jgi:hypothetical protein
MRNSGEENTGGKDYMERKDCQKGKIIWKD